MASDKKEFEVEVRAEVKAKEKTGDGSWKEVDALAMFYVWREDDTRGKVESATAQVARLIQSVATGRKYLIGPGINSRGQSSLTTILSADAIKSSISESDKAIASLKRISGKLSF